MVQSTRELVNSFSSPLESVGELLRLSERFVALLSNSPESLGPRNQSLDVFDELALAMEDIGVRNPRTPLPHRMAFAVSLDTIQHRDIFGKPVDSASLPLVRRARLRKLLRSLNHLRAAAENLIRLTMVRDSGVTFRPGSYTFGQYPSLDLLDRMETVLRRYLRLIQVAYGLTWKKDRDMPSALAGVLTEFLLESWQELPVLAGHLILRSNAETSATNKEKDRFHRRVTRAAREGLENPPEDRTRVLDERDLHTPARFRERNLRSQPFVTAAQRAPEQLWTLIN